MSATATQYDVAHLAGVSQRTVSYTFTRPDRVADDTRGRVFEAAKQLGFRTNSAAKAMRSRRFGAVALVMSTVRHRSRVPDQLLDAIDAALCQVGMHLTLFRMPDEKLTEPSAMPRLMREALVDALLLYYTSDIPKPLREMIDQRSLPAIWLNCDLGHDCIRTDEYAGSRAATEQLLGLGHRRIAYLRFGPEQHYSTVDRRRGYEAAMTDAGLVPTFGPKLGSSDDRLAVSRNWLQSSNRPSAVVCYGSGEAMNLMLAAARLGLDVPEDLSLLTFGDLPYQQTGVDLSRYTLPHEELAQKSIELLERKIAQPAHQFEPVILPLTPHPGRTVGPVSHRYAT